MHIRIHIYVRAYIHTHVHTHIHRVLVVQISTVPSTLNLATRRPTRILDSSCALDTLSTMSAIKNVRKAANGPMDTPDPFLFCVYHKDKYPAGNDKCEAPRVGDGMDFNPDAEYRMYHGEKIPGFPQHPHRGFETITATLEGIIDHTDSMGNAGRYGQGDLQWMTAGRGVVHGEMFPLINNTAPNPSKFFQIWLNLPAKSKMCSPAFVMHWADEVVKFKSDDKLGDVIVWSGSLNEHTSCAPPPDSYASDPKNNVGVFHLTIQPQGKVVLPTSAAVNRWAYFLEGETAAINTEAIKPKTILELKANVQATLENTHSTKVVEILILEGNPIGEPVAQHGPFVMNTQQEIMQAFSDYRATAFGG
eukprot:m.134795 g.134795  ORF g.134795 m.134795 type:complete len:362 (-) comp29758_c0_seq2:133-1218(-)